MIEHLLAADREAEATAAAPTTIDPIQQTTAEGLKDALRRQSVDREMTKNCLRFLGQPMGRSLHVKLRRVHESWADARDAQALLTALSLMAERFGKDRAGRDAASPLRREDLRLICFDFVTG